MTYHTCLLVIAALTTLAVAEPRSVRAQADGEGAEAPAVAAGVAAAVAPKMTPQEAMIKRRELQAEWGNVNRELSKFRKEIAGDPEIKAATEALQAAQEKLTALHEEKLKGNPEAAGLMAESARLREEMRAVSMAMQGDRARRPRPERGDRPPIVDRRKKPADAQNNDKGAADWLD